MNEKLQKHVLRIVQHVETESVNHGRHQKHVLKIVDQCVETESVNHEKLQKTVQKTVEK
jgi:hypothetical protein